MNVWQTTNNKYIFAPVTFECVNSLGDGNFYAGFAPEKYVIDDIAHDFSDRNELCLKEAIYFLENGSASTKGGYIFNRSKQFTENPAWMKNMFILNKSMIKR